MGAPLFAHRDVQGDAPTELGHHSRFYNDLSPDPSVVKMSDTFITSRYKQMRRSYERDNDAGNYCHRAKAAT